MLYSIVVALYAVVLYYIQKPFAKRIASCKDTDGAINIRKKYKLAEKCSFAIFFVLNYLFVWCVQLYEGTSHPHFYLAFIALLVTFTARIVNKFFFSSFFVFNPLSYITIKDFYSYKRPFSLYLRAFETDKYLSESDASVVNEHEFSESLFYQSLYNITPNFYAVGMTKELLSPIGAKRIYLDDNTWKDDVKYLMKKATTIFVLMNKKESCIWEIEQCLSMLDKTCFIVDDLQQYNEIREILKYSTLPNLNELKNTMPFCFRIVSFPYSVIIDGKQTNDKIVCIVNELGNSNKGYKKVVKKLYGK